MIKGDDGKDWPETFDAAASATAFITQLEKTLDIAKDHATMLGWFANAIMRGYDQRSNEEKK